MTRCNTIPTWLPSTLKAEATWSSDLCHNTEDCAPNPQLFSVTQERYLTRINLVHQLCSMKTSNSQQFNHPAQSSAGNEACFLGGILYKCQQERYKRLHDCWQSAGGRKRRRRIRRSPEGCIETWDGGSSYSLCCPTSSPYQVWNDYVCWAEHKKLQKVNIIGVMCKHCTILCIKLIFWLIPKGRVELSLIFYYSFPSMPTLWYFWHLLFCSFLRHVCSSVEHIIHLRCLCICLHIWNSLRTSRRARIAQSV
jgi:hypothetical protein